MYAEDTSIFCIGQSAESAIILLNKALYQVERWCLEIRLTPHPGKSQVLIISKKAIMFCYGTSTPDTSRKLSVEMKALEDTASHLTEYH